MTIKAWVKGEGVSHDDLNANFTYLQNFIFSSAAPGLAPATGGVGTAYFLSADGTWAIPAGGGADLSSVAGNTFYTDYAAPHPAVARLGDRATVGATNNFGLTAGPGTTGYSWLGATYGGGYIERDATFSAYSNAGGFAVAGAARASDWKNTGGQKQAYAFGGTAVADAPNSVAEGAYLETRLLDATSRSWGAEFEVSNQAGPVPTTNPFVIGANASAGGILMAAGGDPTYVTGTVYHSSVAYTVSGGQNQGAAWQRGIVFSATGLVGTNGADSGTGVAINMARNHAIRWDTAANDPPSAQIQSTATGQAQSLVFTDAALVVSRIDTGQAIIKAASAGSVTVGADTATATELQLDGAKASNRALSWLTAGSARWKIWATSTDETGSNAGSDFTLRRYNDAGGNIDSPLTISRATGTATFSGAVMVNGGDAVVAVLQAAGGATTTNVPAGTAGVVKNTTDGSVKLAYNDGGTLKTVALT